jgi:hypothetical protein
MVVNDNAPLQGKRGVIEFFASKLAPTGVFACGLQPHHILSLQPLLPFDHRIFNLLAFGQ